MHTRKPLQTLSAGAYLLEIQAPGLQQSLRTQLCDSHLLA